jgi:type IV pilus assembly protein PilP
MCKVFIMTATVLLTAAFANTQDSMTLAMSLFTQDEPPPANRPKLMDPPSAKPPTPPAASVPVAPAGAQPPPTANTAGALPQPVAPVAPGAAGVPPIAPVQTATVGPATSLPPGAVGTTSRPVTDLTSSILNDGYTYDPKSRRDPFLSMAKLLKATQNRAELPPLQRVELSDVKLIGVVSDHSGYYGLIQTPDGKGYTVRVGTLMGTNNGTIKNIVEQKIIVAEPTLDVTGKMTTREIEILQRPKEGTE